MADVELVLRSGLFDARYYAQATSSDLTDEAAATDYLEHGEAHGQAPSSRFDPTFYAATYADVPATGVKLLLHYAAYGRAEGRYGTLAALREDADALRRSRKVSLHRLADAVEASSVPGLTKLEHNLAGAWRSGARTLRDFDDRFYHDTYRDVPGSGLPPAMHYLRVGLEEKRVARPEQVDELAELLQPHFDEKHYRAQVPELPAGSDALVHYIATSRYDGLDPSPRFSTQSYLARYPDVAADDVEPFLHFLRNGQAEGRSGREDLALASGRLPFERGRPTLVLASHDASRTGAPLVALRIAQEMAKGNNLIVLLGRGGPLSASFEAVATQIGTGTMTSTGYERLFRRLSAEGALHGVVLNSAQTAAVAEGALYAGVPSLALVHEFAEDSDLKVQRMVIAADRVVVPAELLRQSASEEMLPIGSPNHVAIRHQGMLAAPPRDPNAADLTAEDLDALLGLPGPTKVVLGAGYVQMRKGVDLFVQIAGAVRDRRNGAVRFLWVGGGYDPVGDLGYSLYVRETVRRLDLEAIVTFLPEQASLAALFARANLFLLPSRLDPFPNVVIDAFAAGLPVVCFERATGVANTFAEGDASGAAVPFGDVSAAAEAVNVLIDEPGDAADTNRRLVAERFSFDEYTGFLVGALDEARGFSAEIDRLVAKVEQANVFDAAFNRGQQRALSFGQRPLRQYVAAGLKGLSIANPRPGFSDNLYRSRHAPNAGAAIVPLFDALSRGEPDPITHRCHILDDEASLTLFTGKVAIHLHLDDAAFAFDFARRLSGAATPFDIVVTTTTERKRLQCEYAFADHRGGDVQVRVVPDRDRDLGLMIADVRDLLLGGGYAVVGHLAGGGGSEAHRPAIADDRRRQHGIELLLGEGRRMDRSLSLFNEAELSLVFAEDRNAVGWIGNLELAEKLAAQMTPMPVLPSHPFFPGGGMLWVRRPAIAPFWSLDLATAASSPGSRRTGREVRQTVDRMMPSVCEANGLRWCTVHARGAGW